MNTKELEWFLCNEPGTDCYGNENYDFFFLNITDKNRP